MTEHAHTKSNVAHRTDHIRDFALTHMVHSFKWYAEQIGCDRKTLWKYCNVMRATRIDTVEAFLNLMGYTLQVVPLSDRRINE